MIYKTLFGLVDLGSSGLLMITDDKYLAQAVSSGIMDSEITPFYNWDQVRWRTEMTEETVQDILENWNDWCMLGKYQFKPFVTSENKSYNLFKYKKELAQIRLPVTELLIEVSRYYEGKYEIGFSEGGYESTFEILKNPQLIKSYAKSIDSTTMVANQELTLTYDSNKDMRARVYIAYHYYLAKINKISTRAEADVLMTELSNGFSYGHGFE